MGIIVENASGKYGKLFLIVGLLIVLFSEVSAVQRKFDCRKYVLAPQCRGIAAKRDTAHSFSADLRITPPAEDSMDYLSDNQKINANDNFATINGFLGLLKRAMSKNSEYDTSGNYLA